MHRPQRPGDLRLAGQYDVLLSAQARIANSVAHTEALIAAATAALDRTRSILAAHQPADSPSAAREIGARRAVDARATTTRGAV